MSNSDAEILRNAEEYAARFGLTIEDRLGFGYDGIVFSTHQKSAIKALKHRLLYERERDVYLRLHEQGVQEISGFAVPALLNYDDSLWVIEMEIVSPPFVLDFAGAYLDTPPDYPQEVLAEWYLEKQEQFEEKWPQVQNLLSEFRRLGIHLTDVKPGNIMFADPS